jgi:hypothetical protein
MLLNFLFCAFFGNLGKMVKVFEMAQNCESGESGENASFAKCPSPAAAFLNPHRHKLFPRHCIYLPVLLR